MELRMMAIVIIAFGQILRMLTNKSFSSINWLAHREKLVCNLVRLKTLVGWLVIAFGRLVLYLTVVPFNRSIVWLIIIAVLELIVSMHISIKLLGLKIWFAIWIDLLLVIAIAVYVYKLLYDISGLLFVI